MDQNCGGFMDSGKVGTLQSDPQTRPLVEAAVRNLFRIQLRLGMADPTSTFPYGKIGQDAVNTPAHQALALESAEQSLVLLKNKGALPLSKNLKLLVTGRQAHATTNMQGNYFGTAPFLVSPIDGLQKHAT